jgi:NAD(P)H-dependent FMN reductase
MKPKILVITSTTRQARVGRQIADWYIKEAKQANSSMDFELLDIADLNLPILDEPVPPLYAQTGSYNEQQKALAEQIGTADGFVIITGEYNYGVPAPLKNMLDHLAPTPWQRKAVAYVGYGVKGANWSISSLVPTMTYLGVVSMPYTVGISMIWDALDEQGKVKSSHQVGEVAKQLEDLEWWVRSLKAAREATAK